MRWKSLLNHNRKMIKRKCNNVPVFLSLHLKVQRSKLTVELVGWSRTGLPPCHLGTSLTATAAVIRPADWSSTDTLLHIVKLVASGPDLYGLWSRLQGSVILQRRWFYSLADLRLSRRGKGPVSLSLQPPSYLEWGAGCWYIYFHTPSYYSYRPDRQCPPVMMR